MKSHPLTLVNDLVEMPIAELRKELSAAGHDTAGRTRGQLVVDVLVHVYDVVELMATDDEENK